MYLQIIDNNKPLSTYSYVDIHTNIKIQPHIMSNVEKLKKKSNKMSIIILIYKNFFV